MSIISSYIRHNFAKGDRKRDAGLSTPADIQRYDNILYGTDKKRQVLDIYRPAGSSGLLPVIVSVHGGGWVYGDKELYQFYCMSLARRGFAVINFTYRLAPEFRYPAQIEDTDSVIRWLLANGRDHGLDTDNVFAVGDSAGGHLLSVYAAMLTDPQYAARYDLSLADGFRFRAIALNCGVYHQDMPKNRLARHFSLLNNLLPKGWTEEDVKALDSYDKISAGYPPTYVMSSNGDFLRNQVDLIVPQLQKHGIEHEVHIYGSEDEVQYHVFHVNIRYKEAEVCNDDECAFFRRHLKAD